MSLLIKHSFVSTALLSLLLSGCHAASENPQEQSQWVATVDGITYVAGDNSARLRYNAGCQWVFSTVVFKDPELVRDLVTESEEVVDGQAIRVNTGCLRHGDRTGCTHRVSKSAAELIVDTLARGESVSVGDIIMWGDAEGFNEAVTQYGLLRQAKAASDGRKQAGF